MSTRPNGIQTFTPTMDEFSNFSSYIQRIESCGAHTAGVAKIIPPKEWRPRFTTYDTDDVLDFVITSPVEQTIIGQQGVYTLFNVTHRKSLKVRQFRELASSRKYAPPMEDFEELERKYWRNITLNPPMYGADSPGSLYDCKVDEWNIGRLDTILSDVVTNQRIEGVNTAYLYFGMWRSTFSWHTEDMDLYSINYLHYGEPKFWYAIPPEHADRFERLCKSYFSEASKECPGYLRHKMCIISPNVLRNNSIPVNKVVQRQGEFIITFPKGYHAGFNLGYNIAESTNFATIRWINFGKNASLCMCKADSVRINMDSFVYKFQHEQYDEWKRSWQKKQQKFILKQGTLDDQISSDQIIFMKPKWKKTDKHRRTSKDEEQEESVESESEKSEELNLSIDSINNRNRTPSANLDDPYRMGIWAEPLLNLWQFKLFDIKAETEFNERRSLLEPHCCVCQVFVPKIFSKLTDLVPSKGRRIVLDECFVSEENPSSSNPHSQIATTLQFSQKPSSSKQGNRADSVSMKFDELLRCSRCAVVVHRRCYGVRDVDEQNERRRQFGLGWECERCRLACSTAECKLCRLRGGALLPTGTLNWVHVSCALFSPHCKFLYNFEQLPSSSGNLDNQGQKYRVWLDPNQNFGTPPEKNVETDPAEASDSIAITSPHVDNPRRCSYCKSLGGATVRCAFPHCICETSAHITCAYEAGCSLELRRPLTSNGAGQVWLNFICEQHDASRRRQRFKPQQRAFFKRGGKFFRGVVNSVTHQTYCVVDFDDGTFSNDVSLRDVIECQCCPLTPSSGSDDSSSQQHPMGPGHYLGARVTVFWTADRKRYPAALRRTYTAPVYDVIEDASSLRGASVAMMRDSDLYEHDSNNNQNGRKRKAKKIGVK